MAKKKKQQTQQSLSPEKFIREKARLIPIYKCYMENVYRNTKKQDEPKPLAPTTLHLYQRLLVAMLNVVMDTKVDAVNRMSKFFS